MDPFVTAIPWARFSRMNRTFDDPPHTTKIAAAHASKYLVKPL